MSVDEEISEYEALRQKNFKELEALIHAIDTDEFKETTEALNALNQSRHGRKIAKKRKRHDGDETFKFTGQLPLVSRKSARLSNCTPQFGYEDFFDDDSINNKSDDGDLSELEVIVRRPRKSVGHRSAPAQIVPVEEITDQYVANIAERCTVKVYSQNGTSCHQCRQKTLDSKTYCRSGRCIGVRGQFCGVCLKNRYGEDAMVVLRDPNWCCPPCRGLCNCSICRTRQGKRPTGILAPIALRHGHKSVKDFLISLNGTGDYANGDLLSNTDSHNKNSIKVDENYDELLLGFNSDFAAVWINQGTSCNSDDENDLIGFTENGDPVSTKNIK